MKLAPLKLSAITLLFLLASCSDSTTTVDQNYTIESEPYYKYAWHFAYNSQFGSLFGIDPEAHIHIQEAWQRTQGEGVTVAVIDAGSFDTEHEDLKENIIGVYNADFKNNTVSNTTDNASHGSTVAGFIAAPINGKGLIGAAPKAKLLLIQQTYVDDAATIEAFEYAKNNGAKIINNSWGTNNVSQAVADQLQSLKEDGITILFASGNDGCNMDQNYRVTLDGTTVCSQRLGDPINDESELPSVIGVGASSEFNDVTQYSNYGSAIDLIAPGGDLFLSSGLLGLDDSGSFGSSDQRGLVSEDYAFTHGTSFASPITTGVVALMLSVNPALTPDQVREILIQNTDQVGQSANYVNGFDTFRAYGKLNAQKAVIAAQNY